MVSGLQCALPFMEYAVTRFVRYDYTTNSYVPLQTFQHQLLLLFLVSLSFRFTHSECVLATQEK